MKMLKSFGCSFIFGTDLSDSTNLKASYSTWPAHMAKHLGYQYGCLAKGGIGNFQILQRVLDHINFANNDLFVIAWTWADRFDYGAEVVIHHDLPVCSLKTIRPTDDTDLAKIYYKNLHSEYQDKLTTLIYIKTAIDALKQKNIPFIMTFMDDFLLECKWVSDRLGISYLQEQVAPYLTTFEGNNFLNWSRKNKFPESNLWHPLEEAHVAAGEYMFKVFDTQNTSGPTR